MTSKVSNFVASPLTLVHVSDLHYHALPHHYSEWASKRLLGSLNLLLRRRADYPPERFERLRERLLSEAWDHLLISGDFTQLALESEFQHARTHLAPLLEGSRPVHVIPGNHDRYVPEACTPDRFQAFFGRWWTAEEILTVPLGPDWWLIGWDSTHPNSWLQASGTVREPTLAATDAFIQAQPAGTRFVLMNHYPLWFPEGWEVHDRHELNQLEAVRAWVWERPAIRLYLHGHVHRNWHLTFTRPDGSPLDVVNSASSTMRHKPGRPPTSFHRISLEASHCTVEALTL